jgi:hypothetical protein
MLSPYTRMSDAALVYAERQLQIKIARLWPALSPFSQQLHNEYSAKLDELHAEQQRRLTP